MEISMEAKCYFLWGWHSPEGPKGQLPLPSQLPGGGCQGASVYPLVKVPVTSHLKASAP